MEGPEEAAEQELEEMEARSEELDEEIDETRSDWKRKQQDTSVPGTDSGGGSEPQAEEP